MGGMLEGEGGGGGWRGIKEKEKIEATVIA